MAKGSDIVLGTKVRSGQLCVQGNTGNEFGDEEVDIILPAELLNRSDVAMIDERLKSEPIRKSQALSYTPGCSH